MIYSRKFIVIGITLLVIIVASAGALLYFNSRDKATYSLEEKSSSDTPTQQKEVDIDYSQYAKLFTEGEKEEVASRLLDKTTYDISGASLPIKGSVRVGSYNTPYDTEEVYIIDTPSTRTSYSVSIYTDPVEKAHIINVTCVDDSKKIYNDDYCYEE